LALRPAALRVAWLLGIQLLLGAGSWSMRQFVPVITAHVAVGALLLAQAVLLAWHVARSTRAIHLAGDMPFLRKATA
jgi:heme A synthase